MSRYVTELIGTFFLVFVIGMTAVISPDVAPIAIGTALTALVYMGGPVSGAHYNPAVTFAIYVRGSMDRLDVMPYVAAQLAGAVLAGVAVMMITGDTFAPAPSAATSKAGFVVAEVLMTFVLVLVILNVATTRAAEGNQYYGVAIGFTVLGGAYAVGPVSGGAFNPAVGTGPILIDALLGGGSFANLWVYWVAPVFGGLLAVPVFRIQNPAEA